MDHFKDFIDREMPQNEPEAENTFTDMLFDAMGGENAPMLRKCEAWGDICRDRPEIPLTDQQKEELRSWAFTMVVFSGVVDRMADVIERAVHLGYCYARRE